MHCKQTLHYIDNLTSDTINADLPKEISTHIQLCATCQTNYQQHKLYLTHVQQITSPDLAPSKVKMMLKKVQEQRHSSKKKPSNRGFMQGFIAASVLAIALIGTWTTWQNNQAVQTTVATPSFITTEVVLVINTPEDIYDADLNLTLPSKVVLIGYEDSSDLTWPVDLKKGVNTLSLPIRVESGNMSPSPFSIMAKLYHYTEEREFEIKVDLSKVSTG